MQARQEEATTPGSREKQPRVGLQLHPRKRSGGGQRVVVVVPAAADEGDGERDVDGGHGGDRRGEDPDAHLPPEGGAAQAAGGGRGGELGGGDLGERGDEALRTGAETVGALQLGQDELDVLGEGLLAIGGGVGRCCDLRGCHLQTGLRILKNPIRLYTAEFCCMHLGLPNSGKIL